MSIARLVRHLLAALAVVAALAAPALASAADPPRYRAYYDIFDRGPQTIPGHDTSLVPQGLTYWAARDALIVSYYDSAGGASRIALVDRTSGRYLKTLLLNTTGHVGGLGMTSGHLWIANNGKLVRYSAATLDGAGDGATITADRSYDVPASSFVGVRGDRLWVGQFVESGGASVHPYRVGPKGGLHAAGAAFGIPTKVQGMAVAANHFIYARSFGRDNDSRIESYARRVPIANGPMLTAPNMAEGMVVARGQVYVVYESGSDHYDDADYRVRTIHHAPVSALGG